MSVEASGSQEPLSSQCAQFSAMHPNKRPLDQLWDHLARYPDEADENFREHISEYTHGEVFSKPIGIVPGKLRVAAAFGGVLLASEAGNMRAEEMYRRMRPRMRQVGHRVLHAASQPISEAYITDAGSALGIYLAASAADSRGYTAWTASARPSLADIIQLQQETQGRRSSSRGAAGQDFATVETLGQRYLQARFHARTSDRLSLLTLAYGQVAIMTGSLPRFLQNPRDRVSMQHIEDFASSCLRLARTSNLRDPRTIESTSREVARLANPTTARMFDVCARLLNRHHVPAKGHLGGRYFNS